MDYGKYKNARNATWQCLLDYSIKELPVKVTDIISKSQNIKLLKNSEVNVLKHSQSGITILDNNMLNIIYKDTEPSYRCRFTIAHELGHIFLGDLFLETTKYKTFVIQNDIESAANVFARDLLAPACVLWSLNLHTAEEIAKVCNISLSAAQIRADRMAILYKRNKFLVSPLERQIYKQFENFIKEYKNFYL